MSEEKKPEGDGGKPEPLTFDAWLDQQGDDVKALLDGHTKGLKSALQEERAQRSKFEKELREAAKQLEKGSEARKSLEEQADRLQVLERQAGFYDAAHAAGVTNLRLAYLAAQDADLVSERGTCDFARLKADFPQLFGAEPGKGAAGNAGAGTQNPPKRADMNEWIRTAAGRRP